MILKLFKYDFMNIGKKLIPFYIAALVIGVINRFLLLTSNISRMEREGNFLATTQIGRASCRERV